MLSESSYTAVKLSSPPNQIVWNVKNNQITNRNPLSCLKNVKKLWLHVVVLMIFIKETKEQCITGGVSKSKVRCGDLYKVIRRGWWC